MDREDHEAFVKVERKRQAQSLLHHPLIIEFFAEMQDHCYTNMVSLRHDTDGASLRHFALMGQATATLKQKLIEIASYEPEAEEAQEEPTHYIHG